MMLDKGLVQIYTGDGKGKTTAAVGLAVRAAGHNAKVLFYQFLKPSTLNVGEYRFIQAARTDRIVWRTIELPWDMFASKRDPHVVAQIKKAIHSALKEVQTAAHEHYYDVIVLDEIVYCLKEHLADVEDVKAIVRNRDPRVELVLTGRGANAELIEMADLVTEMRSIKHPFENGTFARAGIEY